MPRAIVWFRQDLRLADNPALHHAIEAGYDVIPLYILDDDTPGTWQMGGAQRWWLHHSLASLQKKLPVTLKRGKATEILPLLIQETNAQAIFWNRCYEPTSIARDTQLKQDLTAQSIHTESFNGSLLFEPWQVQNKSGSFFKVFTPFWKQCVTQSGSIPTPLPAPAPTARYAINTHSEPLDDWKLLPTHPNWAKGFEAHWQVSETAAQERLSRFIETGLAHYKEGRNFPDKEYTSLLSPYLHMGQISPRQIWHAVQVAEAAHGSTRYGRENIDHFLSEIGWREFSYHLLYHVPHLPEKPFNPAFAEFPWQEDTALLKAWQRGQTGYPIVDAGMRELWHTGIMHNRVRMIVASLLTKHLLQPWQVGAAWFWDTLVDADLASNSASWQWVAGCGADAAPYFRVFNPVLQGEKFDGDGNYVRKWVPEIARLPNKWLHQPWAAPSVILHASGIVLGKDYPHPIIAVDKGRDRALAAYQAMRGNKDEV